VTRDLVQRPALGTTGEKRLPISKIDVFENKNSELIALGLRTG